MVTFLFICKNTQKQMLRRIVSLISSKIFAKNNKKPGTKDIRDLLPVAGTLDKKSFSLYDDFVDIDPELLAQHIPKQELIPLGKNLKALNARDLKSMRRNHMSPHIYANPMQHLDYRIYESLLKHTFIGALADAFVKYLIGKGFKPELALVNPDQDSEKNIKMIEDNQDIITNLLEIDSQTDAHADGSIDANFTQKVASMIMSALMYNRGALIFDYEKPVKLNNKSYDTIPSNLIFAHAQDLGIIEIDPQTRRLKKVQWRHAYGEPLDVKDMIYLWNPVTSSKVHNSWFYGVSILSPLISSSKMIRTLLSETFPAMAKSTWAGLFYLIIKPEGNTQKSKRAEYEAVSKNSPVGSRNVLIKDPEDVRLDNVNYEPKITEFKEFFESMIKMCISVMGLPQVGFYDEAAANRSTMVGKIQLTMRTTIEPMREWIGDAIVAQWYNRWFQLLYKDKPEILEHFKIRLSWNDLHISEWYDSIEATLDLDGRKLLKDNAFGELANIDNYESLVDPDAETTPGGTGNKKMSMTDSETGNKFEIKRKKGDQ